MTHSITGFYLIYKQLIEADTLVLEFIPSE